MVSKVAALDLGSNSFHLAVVERSSDGMLRCAARSKEQVQLGRGSFETGWIDAEAFARGLDALRRLRVVVEQQKPEAVLAVATSALREAANGAEFVRQASTVAGFPIRMIEGGEEARLVWLGTTRASKLKARRLAIVDLGGGSTEVIVADERGCSFATSLRLGTLRLHGEWTAAHAASSPDASWLAQRSLHILQPALTQVARAGIESLVLSCGSARRLAGLAERLEGEHGESELEGNGGQQVLTRAGLRRMQARLASLGPAERAALVREDPQRADTLWVALAVFRTILDTLLVERALVSEAGLREGLIADYLAQRAPAPALQAVAV